MVVPLVFPSMICRCSSFGVSEFCLNHCRFLFFSYDHCRFLFFSYGDCVCVCIIFFPAILDMKFVGRTSRGHTGGRSDGLFHQAPSVVRALIFLARRIRAVVSLVAREVEFGVVTIDLFSSRWAFFFCSIMRKIPFAGIELTSQRVSTS